MALVLIQNTRQIMKELKERYKRDPEKRMCRNMVTLTPINFVFLKREYANMAGEKHELQPTAESLFQITIKDATTVTVGINNRIEKYFATAWWILPSPRRTVQ